MSSHESPDSQDFRQVEAFSKKRNEKRTFILLGTDEKTAMLKLVMYEVEKKSAKRDEKALSTDEILEIIGTIQFSVEYLEEFKQYGLRITKKDASTKGIEHMKDKVRAALKSSTTMQFPDTILREDDETL